MNILVLGASGLLGRGICEYLDQENVSYIATYNRNIINNKNFYYFDINKLNSLDFLINDHHPTHIINCIVNRIVDDCENKWDEIKRINIDFVSKLVSYNCTLIHISTDYVFDGKNAPYSPESLLNPLQNYGISKYISELRIINACKNYIILYRGCCDFL